MLWRTHFLLGASAGLLLAGHTDLKTAAVSAGIAGVAALLPDLDSPDSWLGRKVPVIPWLLKGTIGHRGPMHSLLGVTVTLALMVFVLRFWLPPAVVWGDLVPLMAAGMLSHLAGDTIAPPGGIPWLWPAKYRAGFPVVPTGSILERFLVTPLALMLCLWLGYGAVAG